MVALPVLPTLTRNVAMNNINRNYALAVFNLWCSIYFFTPTMPSISATVD